MKVKIADTWYDSDSIPILIELSSMEKHLISNMGTQTKFCSFPDSYSEQEINTFMEVTNDCSRN